MKKLNIIIANALIKNGNRGCVALSVSIMYLLDKLLTECGIEYNFYLPDSLFKDGKEHCYEVNGKCIKYTDVPYPVGISKRTKLECFFKNLIDGGKAKSIFKKADYILDIGQGDSFSDIYGLIRFNSIDRIHSLARKYKRPYCILPQTIGPFSDDKIKERAIESIANASVVMARDKQSLDYVKNNVPQQTNIGEYIDVAFFLPYDVISQDSNFINVGLNISALMWNGGYNRNNQFGLVDDYTKIIRSIIEYFLSIPNVKLHLVSHVVTGESHIENDYEVSYKLWREYSSPNLVLAPFALSPIDIKNYIAGLDFFMGARMHATIAAFSSGVPVVPMAYSRKFNGLYEDTLQYLYMTDLKTQNCEEVLSTIKSSFEHREQLKKIVLERINGVVAERRKLLIQNLRKFLKL